MKFISAALSVGALFVIVSAQLDPKCADQFCKEDLAGCLSDTGCKNTVECIKKCWEEETDPMKQQGCTNVCYYTDADDTFDKTFICLTSNKCLKLPPNENTCKSNSLKIQKNISVGDVSGTRWRLRGYNKVYDCYPCQKVTISSTNYNPNFKAVLTDGSTKDVSLTGVLTDNSPKPGFNVTITVGIPWTFTFWPFDSVTDGGNTYFLVYYCGSAADWYYDGAYVLSSATTVSATAMSAISDSFNSNAGLDFSQFCTADMTGC